MCELDKHVGISLCNTARSKFEESASDGIKEPKVEYVLTQLWVFLCQAPLTRHSAAENTAFFFLSLGSGGAFHLRQVSGCGCVSINLEIAQMRTGKIR